MDGRTAFKQITLLGIKGDAYLTRTRAGKETIVFKGRPGLRAKLPGTRYLRAHPIVKEAGFVIGRKEFLEEASKATKIAVICFVAWDIVHEVLQQKPDVTRLGVSILSDIFQAITATYAGVGAMMLVTALLPQPIIITFIISAVATFLTGYKLSSLDSHHHLTDRAVTLAKNIEQSHPINSFLHFAETLGRYCFRSSRALHFKY